MRRGAALVALLVAAAASVPLTAGHFPTETVMSDAHYQRSRYRAVDPASLSAKASSSTNQVDAAPAPAASRAGLFGDDADALVSSHAFAEAVDLTAERAVALADIDLTPQVEGQLEAVCDLVRTPLRDLAKKVDDWRESLRDCEWYKKPAEGLAVVAKKAVDASVSGVLSAVDAVHARVRGALDLDNSEYRAFLGNIKLSHLSADPGSIEQVPGGRGLKVIVDTSVRAEAAVTLARTPRGGGAGAVGFVKATLYSHAPVSARAEGTASLKGQAAGAGAGAGAEERQEDLLLEASEREPSVEVEHVGRGSSDRYDTSMDVKIRGDLVGNLRVRTGSVEVLDNRLNSVTDDVDALEGRASGIVREIRGWRDGTVASQLGFVKSFFSGLVVIAETVEEKIKVLKAKIVGLGQWMVEKAIEILTDVRDNKIIPAVETAVAKTLAERIDELGGDSLHEFLRAETASGDEARMSMSGVEMNEQFLTGSLGQNIMTGVISQSVVRATRLETIREEYHRWSTSSSTASRPAHFDTLMACARQRCEMDNPETHCRSAGNLANYMALFQRVSRRALCYQGRIVPWVKAGKVEVTSAEPFCCDPSGRAHRGSCKISTCAERELPAAVRGDITVTTNKVAFDKIEAAPEVWGDTVYTPILPPGDSCSVANEREGTALWLRKGNETSDTVLDVKLARGSDGENCPGGYQRVSRTYLGHHVANLRGTSDGALHGSNANTLFLCLKVGPYGPGAVTDIQLVSADAAADGAEGLEMIRTSVSKGLDASFSARPSCSASFVAVRRVQIPEELLLIPPADREYLHREGPGAAPSSAEDLLLARDAEDTGNLGFGIWLEPPAPEAFPGLNFRVWLHDVKPLSYMSLREVSFEYRDDVPWTAPVAEGAPAQAATSGPGFDLKLDLKVAAEASVMVLGTEMFTTMTVGELIAIILSGVSSSGAAGDASATNPGSGSGLKVSATKFPGAQREHVLFSTKGAAGMSVDIAASAQLWFQRGGSGDEVDGWRLRITGLTLRSLDMQLESEQEPVNWLKDFVFEGLDTVEIIKDLLDIKGLELGVAGAMGTMGEYGDKFLDLRGKGAVCKGKVEIHLPERMMDHDGLLKPVYVMLRKGIKNSGSPMLGVSE